MRMRFTLAAAAAAILATSSITPAFAEGFNPGKFQVQMDSATQSEMSQQPDCTPSMTSAMSEVLLKGSVDVACTMKMSGPMNMNGTVTNSDMVAKYGADFTSGKLESVCDMNQLVEMKMVVSMTAPSLKSLKGSMFQNCSWKMTWSDPKSTSLSGTMEMNGKLGSDDGSVDPSGNVDMSMTMKMYVTGGTGEFEGYVGSGEFTRSENVPMMGGAGATPPSGTGGAGGGAGGAGGNGGAGGAGATPPTGAELVAFCQQQGIPADQCNSSLFSNVPQGLRAAATRSAMKVLAAAGTEEGMDLELVKAPGQVRILSPSAPAGQPGAAAKVTAKSKVEIVATAGSQCVVKNNKKKVVASGTSVSSSAILVMKAKKGAYTGAKTIQATCTNAGGSFKSNKVKVHM